MCINAQTIAICTSLESLGQACSDDVTVCWILSKFEACCVLTACFDCPYSA